MPAAPQLHLQGTGALGAAARFVAVFAVPYLLYLGTLIQLVHAAGLQRHGSGVGGRGVYWQRVLKFYVFKAARSA